MKKHFVAAIVLALSSPFAAAAALTDAEIAHIAYTAGELDIAAAKQALAKTDDPEIEAFARTMARDHAAVNEQALALVKRLGMEPADNEVSRSLVEGAKAAASRLDGLSGDAFDAAYAQNEVAFHQQVNDALRTTLIPGAKHADLRKLLESGLALFSEHQKHAESLSGATGHP